MCVPSMSHLHGRTQQGLTGSHYLLLSTGGGWRWQWWEPGTRFIFDEKGWGSGEDDYGGKRGERSAQRTLIGRDGSPTTEGHLEDQGKSYIVKM